MAAIRKETLDILKHELTNPSTFLKQMLDCSKTGMVSLNIVQQMSKELCKLPLDYLVHCLSKDKHGFAYDPVEGKVCLDSQLKTRLTKTTAFGTIDPEDEEDAEPTRVYPEYKTPFFRPMFSLSQKVFPIFFDNDGFFVDDLPEKQVNPEKPNIDVPEHDVYGMEPLTNHERHQVVLHSGSFECFNCGANDHIFSECTQTTNIKRINRKKRQLKTNSGRLYQQLEVQSKRDTFIPGILSPALKDALGLSKEDQEPPYYHNMRMHGYPPAYIVDADPSKPTPTFYSVYQQPFNEDECEDLKIYDDAYIESNHEKTHKEPKETVHVKLIDYGIDFTLGIDTSKLDSAIQQYHSTYDNSYQYPTEYSQQNIAADYYAYYYSTCYDYYPAYDQYSTALPPPPAAASEPAGAVLSSSTEPALGASIPSSHLAPSPHINVSNEQTYSLVDGQANAHDDDNDSVDMDISDDDDM